MRLEVTIMPGPGELARTAAAEVLGQARAAVQSRGVFTFVLAGGSTPRALYSLLADEPSLRQEMPWEQTHFFWGDERPVPPDHPESNYRMAHEAMLAKIPVPERNIHRIPSEQPDAAEAAALYETMLLEFFRPGDGRFPRFDLVLLGLGGDGHTASLFPGTKALAEERRWVAANWVEKLNTWRLTMTAPLLNQAGSVAFLVNGAEKAPVVRDVLQGERRPEVLPSQLIQPTAGRLLWLLDEAAAGLLQRGATG